MTFTAQRIGFNRGYVVSSAVCDVSFEQYSLHTFHNNRWLRPGICIVANPKVASLTCAQVSVPLLGSCVNIKTLGAVMEFGNTKHRHHRQGPLTPCVGEQEKSGRAIELKTNDLGRMKTGDDLDDSHRLSLFALRVLIVAVPRSNPAAYVDRLANDSLAPAGLRLLCPNRFDLNRIGGS